MEQLRLDSHKLIFHPKEVSRWMDGKSVFPINAEIGISGACNHRCSFCCVDYMGYKAKMLEADNLLRNLKLMAEKGLKSVNYAGDGEPLLNKDVVKIINGTKELGIDVGLTTNGVLFSEEVAKECISALTWVRFSTSAYSKEVYNSIHNGRENDLELVFENITNAVKIKREMNVGVTLGLQIVLLPENIHEVVKLGEKSKEMGVDYYTVKSFGIQPQSGSELKETFNIKEFYRDLDKVEKELSKFEDESFSIYVRVNRSTKLFIERTYDACHALPFYTFISSSGDVWPCCILMGNEGMRFGNINEKSFIEIWEGEERKKAIKNIEASGFSMCSPECRLDEMNRYLQSIKNPGAHVNFI